MRPATVLYLTTSGQIGGAERCLMSLVAGLDRERYRASVLIGSAGPLEGQLQAASVAAAVLPLPAAVRRLSRYHPNRGLAARLAPWWETPWYLARLRYEGRRAHPSLIHSNGPKMHILSALLRRQWGVPLVWHLHDFPAGEPGGAEPAPRGAEPWFNRALQRLSAHADAIIANSHAVARAYAERLPALAAKLRVVPNGLNPQCWAQGDGRGFRHRFGVPDDAFVFGMVSIFAPWKGQEIFLEAARRVHECLPQTRFLLAGEDIYDTTGHGGRGRQLREQARASGLDGVVTFTGYLAAPAELAAAYASLDVMVHASTRPEPFGRTIIEAMAAGVPVIAARGGGVPEIIADGRDGVLTPPGDAAALAEAMVRLHADAGRRRALAEQARQRVQEQFSEAAVSGAVAAVYDELLERRR
jgi:glycosyltransferase involved in cell wall biosynthesis